MLPRSRWQLPPTQVVGGRTLAPSPSCGRCRTCPAQRRATGSAMPNARQTRGTPPPADMAGCTAPPPSGASRPEPSCGARAAPSCAEKA
eukprot:scaffold1543_cov102-Isochrysis_galbana.AAC.4